MRSVRDNAVGMKSTACCRRSLGSVQLKGSKPPLNVLGHELPA